MAYLLHYYQYLSVQVSSLPIFSPMNSLGQIQDPKGNLGPGRGLNIPKFNGDAPYQVYVFNSNILVLDSRILPCTIETWEATSIKLAWDLGTVNFYFLFLFSSEAVLTSSMLDMNNGSVLLLGRVNMPCTVKFFINNYDVSWQMQLVKN